MPGFDFWGIELLDNLFHHVPCDPINKFQFRTQMLAMLFLEFLEQHLAETEDMAERIVQVMAGFDHTDAQRTGNVFSILSCCIVIHVLWTSQFLADYPRDGSQIRRSLQF